MATRDPTGRSGRLTVGVTGHRPNRLHIGLPVVARRLGRVLVAVRQGTRMARSGPPEAISSVAEGADRLFADAALASGFRLVTLLPFARDAYVATFSDKAAIPHYRALLDAADVVHELPGMLADTKSAYEVAGRTLVDRSDIIVAIWDGGPTAGRGGTPEIVAYALAKRKPVIWIDAVHDRPPRLISSPTAHGRREVALDRLASRARSLTQRHIIRLASAVVGSKKTPRKTST